MKQWDIKNPYQDIINWLESDEGQFWSYWQRDISLKSVLVGIKNDESDGEDTEWDAFIWYAT